MRKFRLGLIVASLLSIFLLSFGPGCTATDFTDIKSQSTAALAQASNEVTETQNTIAALKAQAATMPAGKERDNILAVLAKAEGVLTKAQQKVKQASDVLDTINGVADALAKGEISPGLTGALSTVPYGVYIGFGLSALFAIKRQLDTSKLKTTLTNVVKSWEVGPELSPEDKAKVAAIQGPQTEAVVAEIQKTL